MNLLKISMLSLMFIALTGFGQTAFAKAPDDQDGDGVGSCDVLDDKGGLYSMCIRGHSTNNLIAHLKAKDVGGPALEKALRELGNLQSDYTTLYNELHSPLTTTGIPGLAPPPGDLVCATGECLKTDFGGFQYCYEPITVTCD
jgi:hypothetical protein